MVKIFQSRTKAVGDAYLAMFVTINRQMLLPFWVLAIETLANTILDRNDQVLTITMGFLYVAQDSWLLLWLKKDWPTLANCITHFSNKKAAWSTKFRDRLCVWSAKWPTFSLGKPGWHGKSCYTTNSSSLGPMPTIGKSSTFVALLRPSSGLSKAS